MHNHLKIREIQGYTINNTIFTQMHLGMPSEQTANTWEVGQASAPGTWPNIRLVLGMPYLSFVFSSGNGNVHCECHHDVLQSSGFIIAKRPAQISLMRCSHIA